MKTINSLRSKLLALTLALMASVASFAYDEMPPDFKVDGLYYNFLEGDNVEVTHPYRPALPTESASNAATQDSPDDYANLTELIIPSTVTYEGNVYHVTRIGHHAFDQCENLTSVDIPNSIKSIGIRAFSWCSALTSIVLKGGLENIESYAFEYCLRLENISLPNSLMTIGQNAFYNTQWYKNQPNGGVYVGNVFYKYKGDIPQNTSFVIKEGTVSISPYAFVKENYHEDYSLVSVSIPNSVKVIGEGVFYRCRALTSIVIPAGVTTIETLAFDYCKALKSVTCEAVNPPALSGSVFLFTPIADATLYVPAESIEAYKTATEWKDFGQILPIETTLKEQFPFLVGLQRTEVEFHTDGADAPSLVSFNEYTPTFVNGKWYLYDGRNYLREENNQVLLYSPEFEIYEDLVLYDWTLEIGDTLPFTIRPFDDDKMRGAVFRVTDVSTITLLDGKEYKKWTLACGIEYIEGIGAINGEGFGNYFCIQHTAHPATYIDTRLVCASRNGQLLYQMDEAEMERLGTECLCAGYLSSYKSQWCDTWNVMWFDGMRFDETASTSQYQLGKDTIIGDYTYSKFTSRTSVRFTNDRKVYVYYEGFDDNDPYTEDLPTGEYLAYDFSAQVGDTLEVFSGSHSYTTEQCVVYDVQTDPETNLRTIMLHPLRVVDSDGNVGVSNEEITWLEGVGSPNGFLITTPLPGGGLFALLCAYKGDELKYTGSFYERFGCDYNAGVISDDLFPTLSGLQRTICREYYEQADNKTRIEQFTNLTTRTETGGPYLYYSPFLLREKDNKILIYSRSLNKDLVLYDFNLQVGDSLPMLYIDFFAKDDWIADRDMEIWCIVDYHKDLEGNILPADTLIVTDVSAITLLDGKEYKKWTFNNGMEYVEGIGSFGNRQWSGDFFQLIANRDVPTSLQGEHLVCASRNGQLLYQMDDAEMERFGAECLCDVETSYKSQWCDTWNIFVENGSVYPPHEETYRYQLAKDTVIGDYTYTAVVSKAINDALDAPHYVAAVRFTDDRKVYIYYDNAEYLLYDFNVQEGEELEVFAGINNYTSEIKTYKCTVTGVEQYACVGCPATITLEVHNHPDDFREFYRQTQWIEGVGDINGFLNGINGYINIPGNAAEYLLCAHKGDELKYTGPLYEEYGCEYNAGPFNEKLLGTWRVVGGNEIISISDSIIVFIGLTQKYTASATQLTVERLWIPEEESYRWANCNYTLSNDTLWIDNFMPLLVATYPPTFGPITLVKVKHEDLFPTLWGLQRTGCTKTIGENGNGTTVWGSRSYLMQEIETATIDGKQYLLFGTNNIYDEYCSLWLREENNKILLYSTAQKKDLVLYDFTLNVGDSLPRLYVDYDLSSVVDYDNDEWGLAPLVVTEVSTITLLDGKEYKKWTFDNGIEYVEGIGSFGSNYGHNDFYQLIANAPLYSDVHSQHLVCVSKNNKLLYQMDPVKMDKLGTECLCDYDRGPRKDNAKNGKIGGRPTPTQWNMLEVETKEMDGTPTILRAETFSYTLENDSIVTKGKTYYQLARQSTKDTAITKSFVGALHFGEDEDNRVYFLRDGVEYVLYDFTAEPGDTVEIFAGINNYPQETTYTHVVVDKDTTEDGACRMFLEVVFLDETTTAENVEKVWLAGLGSIDGIVHNAAQRTSDVHAAPRRSASSETQSSVMLCAWREDSCLYTTNHPEYDTFGCVYNQDPTAVENLTSPSSYQKIIHEGTLLILHEGKVYNVIGIQIK